MSLGSKSAVPLGIDSQRVELTSTQAAIVQQHNKARIFLLVDLQDFFSDLGSGGGGGGGNSENDQLTGHFQSFFFIFFFIFPEKTVKLGRQTNSMY